MIDIPLVSEAKRDTVINCALPAKSTKDINKTPIGDIPVLLANTPKAIPIGKYPKTIGSASFIPLR